MDAKTALKLVENRSWHHDWEILPGVRTNGTYNPEGLFQRLDLPKDMSGFTVADVGASNGFFSFSIRTLGASVTAFDYRHRDNSGFGLAQFINGMADIPHHHVNILQINPENFQQWDYTLCLGLLYHTADPYRALYNCAMMTRGILFVESYCLDNVRPAFRGEPVALFLSDPMRFPGEGQPNSDRSNFWCPTSECLKRMTLDMGFDVNFVEVTGDRVLIKASKAIPPPRGLLSYRTMPAVVATGNLEDSASWRLF